MNKLYTLFAISLLALAQTVAYAQSERSITGIITDHETQTGLPGVVVEIVGSNTGTVTDEKGQFKIATFRPFPFTLKISSVGYKTQQYAVTDSSAAGSINLVLESENENNVVTVTARRREETLQDVPIPVTVIGGRLVEDAGAFNVNRVKELVPTVQLYSSNPRNTTLNIRGLGSTFGLTNDGIDPGVGFYVDGVYFARPAATALDFVDVERIEVLRGPQGTLFGKNTTAGAFNIITRKPSFKPGATFELSYGNYGYIQAKTSITGGLIKDKLATRISFSGTQRDGNIYNVRTDKYLNDLNNLGGRIQFLYRASDKVDITLTGDATRQRPNEGYAQVIAGVVPTQRSNYRQFRSIISDLNWQLPSENAFDRKVDQNSTWRAGNDLGGVSLNVDAKIGPGTLTSTTAWRYWAWDPMNDRDFTGLNATAKSQATSKHEQVSQEVRYAGEISKKLSGVVGVYFIHQNLWTDPAHIEEAGEDQWRFQATNNNAVWQTPGLFDGHGSRIYSKLQTTGAAAFANIDWAITPKIHVLPGLRYNFDQKTVNFKREAYGLYDTTGSPLATQIAAIRTIYNDQQFSFTASESNLTGQLTVAYKPTEKINTFATFSTSYKPIGVNLGGLPNVGGQPDLSLAQVRPEYTTHYEAGIKTSPGKNSTLNLVGHYTDVKDYQTLVQDPNPALLRGYLATAEHVRVLGVELDASTRIQRHVWIFGAVAYTDGKYVSFKNAPLPLEETGSTAPFKDISGERLPGISKWAGSLGVELTTNEKTIWGNRGKFFVAADTYYRSEFSSSPTPSRYLNIEGYALVNGRLGFRASEGLSLFVWGRNLLGQNYYEQLLPGAGNAGHYAAVLGDPRTYGVTLRAQLGAR